jgi:hypothetical protein
VRVREVPAVDFESPTSTAQSTTALFLTSYLCPFADLLLWDSRTVHCNTPALSQAHFFSLPEEERLQQAAAQPRDLIRLCSYVCMLPRSHATPEELRTKVIMFSNRCDSPRHSTSCPPFFSVFPRPTGPHKHAPSQRRTRLLIHLNCPRCSANLLVAKNTQNVVAC